MTRLKHGPFHWLCDHGMVMGMERVPGAQGQHQPWGGGRSGAGGRGLTWPAPSALQRHSLVTDKCFLSAIECLQKIITTMDPREKLEVLERTYGEIEATVSRVLGQEHKLPMDDLLPLLIYVVSRAR